MSYFCKSCGQEVNIDELILEEICGFEGEAWGTYMISEPGWSILSPCCRDEVEDEDGDSPNATALESERRMEGYA